MRDCQVMLAAFQVTLFSIGIRTLSNCAMRDTHGERIESKSQYTETVFHDQTRSGSEELLALQITYSCYNILAPSRNDYRLAAVSVDERFGFLLEKFLSESYVLYIYIYMILFYGVV
jgi:hypothetical protein